MLHLAVGNLFSSLGNLVTSVGKLAGAALVVGIGIKAFSHVWQENHGSAVALALVALLPAAYLLDPSGVTSLYNSTVAQIAK
jgi:hypothetical protein